MHNHKSAGLDPDLDMGIEAHEISSKLKALLDEYGYRMVLCRERGVSTLQLQRDDKRNTALTLITAAKVGMFQFVAIGEQRSADDALPKWLDKEAWAEWEQYRKEIGKPLTARMRRGQLEMLEGQHKIGLDHAACIRHSIQQGYIGLFPAKRTAVINRGAAAVDAFAGG